MVLATNQDGARRAQGSTLIDTERVRAIHAELDRALANRALDPAFIKQMHNDIDTIYRATRGHGDDWDIIVALAELYAGERKVVPVELFRRCGLKDDEIASWAESVAPRGEAWLRAQLRTLEAQP